MNGLFFMTVEKSLILEHFHRCIKLILALLMLLRMVMVGFLGMRLLKLHQFYGLEGKVSLELLADCCLGLYCCDGVGFLFGVVIVRVVVIEDVIVLVC